jgi:hypothetical protein
MKADIRNSASSLVEQHFNYHEKVSSPRTYKAEVSLDWLNLGNVGWISHQQ